MTIYDIAGQLKLSPATVSMALNDDSRVAQKTRTRVIEYAENIGFKRNEQARNFRLKRTNTIAVVVYNIDNDFWSGIVKAIENQLGESYSVIICNSDENLEKEYRIIKSLKQRQVDGIIIQPVSADISHLAALNREGISVVLFEKTENPELSFVKGNDYLAAYRLTKECIAAGHQRIALLSFATPVIGVQDRIEGFKTAVSEAGFSAQCDIYIAAELSDAAVEQVIMENIRNFSLALCIDDRIACLLLKCLEKAKIKVPEQLSVIGWNNSKFLDYLPIPLTSVCIPVETMGIHAAQIILEIMAGGKTAVKQYVDEKIIYRQSYRKII